MTPQRADLLELVNPLQGSESHFRFSAGNCAPLVARPFGMTHWAPQTDEDGWFFREGTRQLQGFRATHQPSPWIGEYGHFTVMAQTGQPLLAAGRRSSGYRPQEMKIAPHYLSVYLRRYSTRMELTPTERCSVFRFTFPNGHPGRVIIDTPPADSGAEIGSDHRSLSGFTRANNGGVTDRFACYYAARFSRPFESGAAVKENRTAGSSASGTRIGAAVEFSAGAPVEMSIGTSFISVEQAFRNLDREVGARSFDDVKSDGETLWNDLLGQIEVVGGTQEQRTIFYSGLYRANLFPRIWHELDADGNPIHHSPYDGETHPGVLYADNGFWDTYRTVYSLFSILIPDRLGEMVEGWIQAYREGGWFPQWASPGYRACMVGTHIDAVIADACVKDVRGFNREDAYAGMVKHASIPGDEAGSYGRVGVLQYLEKGFVPADQASSAVARTLDYAYDDFCISQVAAVLGKSEEQRQHLARASYYRHCFDPSVGLMRGKLADGSWDSFDEHRWGDPYVEGGAWQCSWAVQHDPAGLIELMGGAEAFVKKLDQMLEQEPVFDVGTYGFEIHEMTEMAAVPFGQYAHSNQPVHHVLYLYAAAGYPWKTQYWVRRVLNELYSTTRFCGDEDNGEMSAWYILSALGLFPLCPGHPTYVLGSPLFPMVKLQLPGGKTLVIEADGASLQNVYVAGVTWNGEPHDRLWIGHQELMSGGHLRFQMTDQPVKRDYSAEQLPFSLSTAG